VTTHNTGAIMVEIVSVSGAIMRLTPTSIQPVVDEIDDDFDVEDPARGAAACWTGVHTACRTGGGAASSEGTGTTGSTGRTTARSRGCAAGGGAVSERYAH